MSEVQTYSLKCCVELDQAVSKGTDEDKLDDIGGILWQSVYNERDEIDVDHVLQFAKYIYFHNVFFFLIRLSFCFNSYSLDMLKMSNRR